MRQGRSRRRAQPLQAMGCVALAEQLGEHGQGRGEGRVQPEWQMEQQHAAAIEAQRRVVGADQQLGAQKALRRERQGLAELSDFFGRAEGLFRDPLLAALAEAAVAARAPVEERVRGLAIAAGSAL